MYPAPGLMLFATRCSVEFELCHYLARFTCPDCYMILACRHRHGHQCAEIKVIDDSSFQGSTLWPFRLRLARLARSVALALDSRASTHWVINIGSPNTASRTRLWPSCSLEQRLLLLLHWPVCTWLHRLSHGVCRRSQMATKGQCPSYGAGCAPPLS